MPLTPFLIDTPLDLDDNTLHNALVDDVQAGDGDLQAANKGYVDRQTTVDTDITDTIPNANVTVGGIDPSYTIKGKLATEVLSDMLIKNTPPTYSLPTVSLGYVGTFSNEVGASNTLTLSVTINYNDSAGLMPNGVTFSGTHFGASVSQNGTTYNITFNTKPSNIFNVDVHYQGATVVKNDTYGNPVSTGMFPSGHITATFSLTGYYEYFIGVINGDVAAPANQVGMESTLSSFKVVGDLPSMVRTAVPIGGTKTMFVVVPNTGGNISITKDGFPIHETFTYSTMGFTFGGSQSKNYRVWWGNNGVGYGLASDMIVTNSQT